MPIYEYACKACGHEWEDFQKITDDPVEICPSCNAPKAQRLISQTSFILKGSGWYVTDYGKGNSGQSKNKQSSTSSKEESSSSKTETKSSSSKSDD